VEVTYPELVHLPFDCVGQSRGVGQGICRKLGGVAEAGEIQRDHVIVRLRASGTGRHPADDSPTPCSSRAVHPSQRDGGQDLSC